MTKSHPSKLPFPGLFQDPVRVTCQRWLQERRQLDSPSQVVTYYATWNYNNLELKEFKGGLG